MKYLIVLVILFSPFVVKAAEDLTLPTPPPLLGFLDGNMYDSVTGKWRCMYLMDGNCYSLDQKILATRPVGSETKTVIAPSTPQYVYVPVYVPAPYPSATVPNVPVVGGATTEPPVENPIPASPIKPDFKCEKIASAELFCYINNGKNVKVKAVGYNISLIDPSITVKIYNQENLLAEGTFLKSPVPEGYPSDTPTYAIGADLYNPAVNTIDPSINLVTGRLTIASWENVRVRGISFTSILISIDGVDYTCANINYGSFKFCEYSNI